MVNIGLDMLLSRKIRWCNIRIAAGIMVLLLFLLAGSAGAVPVEEWNKTFGGTKDDNAYSVAQTRDGGYILAGWTESCGAGKKDAWLIKTDANGSEQWNKTFGGKGDDGAHSVQQTSDGGYILAGYTESYGAGKHDVWLVRTDAEGIELWNRTFGGANDDEAYSVRQISDGGYVLAGNTYSYDAGNHNAWIIKTNTNGNEVWNRTGDDLWNRKNGISEANSIEETRDSGYIFAGMTSVEDGGPMAAWLVKTDADGKQQWSRTFGGHADWANSVRQTLDSGYVFAGKMYIPGGALAWLIKTDANGKQQWSRTFGGLSSAEVYRVETWANSVQQTSDGGYILAGYTVLYKSGMTNAYALLIKTDAEGNEQWNRTFGGTSGDAAYSVQQAKDGGYILAGNTKSIESGGSDAWLIKVDGAPVETAEAPTASPTSTLIPVPTEPLKVSPTEKAAGFEIVLAITILLAVYIAGRRRK
ncbi:MAG: hypothetical protein OIN66_16450 [Candidatus Methanoperedens sp.]|nr:hypothetical protein [Candidatus Methanoperedens sp.]